MAKNPVAGATPAQMAAVLDGAAITNSLPYIENVLGQMEKLVMTKTAQRYRKGELTPELAKDAWIELFALRSLFANLKSLAAASASAIPETDNG